MHMKKLLISMMTLSCLLLCACGDMHTDNTILPDSMMPMESMMPDVEDGIVRDEDGEIEEREEAETTSPAPGSTARP